MFEFSINTVQFEGAMQKLRKEIRLGTIHPAYGTLAVQGRLFAERCQQLTPPFRQGKKKGDNGPGAMSVGKRAVARDLHRVFYPLSPSTFPESKRIQQIIRRDDRVAWEAVSRNFAARTGLRGAVAVSFSPSLHKNNRVSRGRVRGMGNAKRGPYRNLGMVTLGAQAKRAREYTGSIKQRVGWAKAGWNAGILGLGGNAGPDWIFAHGSSGGSLQDGRNAPDPFIKVINRTGWARYNSGEGNRIIRAAIATRARDIEKYAVNMARVAAERATRGLPVLPSAPA